MEGPRIGRRAVERDRLGEKRTNMWIEKEIGTMIEAGKEAAITVGN